MELALILKLVGAAADIAQAAAPHLKDALATASETDAAQLKADLARLAEANDAAFETTQGELRGGA